MAVLAASRGGEEDGLAATAVAADNGEGVLLENGANDNGKVHEDRAAGNGASTTAAVADGEANDEADEQDEDDEDDQQIAGGREKRRQRRRRRKKKKDKAGGGELGKQAASVGATEGDGDSVKVKQEDDDDATALVVAAKAEEDSGRELKVEVEYVAAKPEMIEELNDPAFAELREVFAKLATGLGGGEEQEDGEAGEAGAGGKADGEEKTKEEKDEDEEDGDEDEDEDKDGLSKRKKKMLQRLSVAQLKQECRRPEVVEVWDTTSADPKLLVFLKAYRNTVPVPRHWSQKRKYLQGKRGIEKIPFQLPDFIAATGIEKLRQTYTEKEDAKKLKQKQRDKMQPKMGKMDIDYQVLHDAFFKYQTKPKMTRVGDLYYEGKEFEIQMKEKRPGILSEELREALGIPSSDSPPPWLVSMQRFGPPPSYPTLKIPGLNAPIPKGAKFGYQPGEWGKPPVDEMGKPIYGDVFGAHEDDDGAEESVDRTPWGELAEEEEEEEEEELESEDEEAEEGEEEGDLASGISSVDSFSSVPSGVETPDVIDLRKAGRKDQAPVPDKPLYQVLEEKQAKVGTGEIMGSDRVYAVPGGKKGAKGVADKVEVTLAPEELEELDDGALAAKYEAARVAEKEERQGHEDFSDMVAEEARKRKRKEDAKKDPKKKQKDFKF